VDEYTLKALKENLSLMAVDPITNKVLGESKHNPTEKERFFSINSYFSQKANINRL
jgi:hypothetical protein